MKNSIIAKTYAQAVIGAAKEARCDIYKEISDFVALLNTSGELEQVLFLNVFTEEEKKHVLNDVLEKIKVHDLTKTFLQFLVAEKRISLIPQIYKELIIIEDSAKGFMKVTVEGSQNTLDEQAKKTIEEYLYKRLNVKSEINYKKSEQISAGYKVIAGDYLLDATLKTQLNNFKNSFFE